MKNLFPLFAILGSLMLTASCTTTVSAGSPSLTVPKNSSVKNIGMTDPEPTEEPGGVITLDDALQAAMGRHPSLAAAWHEIKAHEGKARQAGMIPNPSLSGEFEEFSGSGEYSGRDIMSASIGISQEFPLGGKLAKRVQEADAETELSVQARAVQIITLQTEVKKRFIRVHMLQEQLKLEQEKLRLVKASSDAISKRVSAGEASPLDQAKIAVELASAGVAVERVKRELDAARYALASSWAGSKPTFTEVRANYPMVADIPSENELLTLIEENPAYRILGKRVSLASASLNLAKAEAWMDIELGGGVQQFEETNDHAYFFEVSIPIPLFDRNQGAIQAARESLNSAEKRQEAGMLELKENLLETAKRLGSVQYAFLAMQNTVLPAAEKAYVSVQKGYMAGEQDYLEFLDAQHTLLETRRERLELLSELQELRAELESFTAYSAQ